MERGKNERIGQVRHPKEWFCVLRAWVWLMYQPGNLQQWKLWKLTTWGCKFHRASLDPKEVGRLVWGTAGTQEHPWSKKRTDSCPLQASPVRVLPQRRLSTLAPSTHSRGLPNGEVKLRGRGCGCWCAKETCVYHSHHQIISLEETTRVI